MPPQATKQQPQSLSTLGDVEQLLFGGETTFTLDVVLPFQVGDVREERTITIDYVYDEEIEDRIAEGITEDKPLIEDGEELADTLTSAMPDGAERDKLTEAIQKVTKTIPVHRRYTTAEQLAMIVRRVRGIEKPLTVKDWGRLPRRHQIILVRDIRADVYPNETPSAPSAAGTSTGGQRSTGSPRETRV
jgi:hypothetical protein